MSLRSGVEKAASPFFARALPFFLLVVFLVAFFAETGKVNTAVLGVTGWGFETNMGLGGSPASDKAVLEWSTVDIAGVYSFRIRDRVWNSWKSTIDG